MVLTLPAPPYLHVEDSRRLRTQNCVLGSIPFFRRLSDFAKTTNKARAKK